MFYAFEMEEKMLPYVAGFVGADRLVFATDYNHSDSKFPHTVEEVMERKDLSEALKAKLRDSFRPSLYSRISAAPNTVVRYACGEFLIGVTLLILARLTQLLDLIAFFP